ncbi:MAG: phage portal protein [Desulfurellales bacterium]|nr:MAG: phage portal protein [Desulfurellales bacterium]
MAGAKRKKNRGRRPAASRQTIFETPAGAEPVSELIGRYVVGDAQMTLFRSRSYVKTVDETIPDYEFYDRLRRCKAKGYTLGGLFAKRIERVIASWVLGGGLTVTLHESQGQTLPKRRADYTNGLVAEFVQSLLDAGIDSGTVTDDDDRNNSLLLSTYKDSLGLGDQYIIVNADGSLSVASPDTVTVKRDPLNYRRVLSVTLQTRTDGYIITDEYRPDGRTVTVKRGDQLLSAQSYQNLLGVIPVVHIAHDRSGNETYGHPIHEELLPLYDQYDDLIYKQLDGAKLLGNPLLTFAGMEDINAVINANDTAEDDQYYDKDGNLTNRKQLNIDSNAVLLIGKGGSASFTSPPVGFTADTKTALKSLFLLLLDHTGIPEFVWGGEMGSARASSDTQMSQFVKDIEGWRLDAGGWIIRLCKLWLMTKALTDPKALVGTLALEWPPLVQEDKEIRLKQVETGRKETLLTDETALALLDLVDDPATEVAAARKEAQERQEQMVANDETLAFNRGLDQAQQDAQNGGDDEPGSI